eukprot:747682-Hanusia_phi.AAC.3
MRYTARPWTEGPLRSQLGLAGVEEDSMSDRHAIVIALDTLIHKAGGIGIEGGWRGFRLQRIDPVHVRNSWLRMAQKSRMKRRWQK